jgi:hypothetical protein
MLHFIFRLGFPKYKIVYTINDMNRKENSGIYTNLEVFKK